MKSTTTPDSINFTRIINSCNEPISSFVFHKNLLFYSKGSILKTLNAMTNHKETIEEFDQVIDEIFHLNDILFLFSGNTCKIYNYKLKKTIKTHSFSDVPDKIQKYDEKIYVLSSGALFVLTKSSFEEIVIKRNVVDFSVAAGNIFTLLKQNNGDEYRSVVLLNNLPVKYLEKKPNQKDAYEDIEQIEAFSIENKNLIFFITRTAQKTCLYKLSNTFLVLQYEFGPVERIFRNFGICVNKVIHFTKIPTTVINESVCLGENCAISRRYIYLLTEKKFDTQSFEHPQLRKIDSVAARINNLFSISFNSSMTIPEFRQEIDRLKAIFLELKSLNDTFPDKVHLLKNMLKDLKLKQQPFRQKREALQKRCKVLTEKIEKIVLNKKKELIFVLENVDLQTSRRNELKMVLARARLQNQSLKDVYREI